MAQFQLSEKEFVQACLRIRFRRRTIILFFVAMALMILSLSGSESWAFTIIVGGLVIGFVAGLTYFLSAFKLRKTYREQQSLQEVITVTINDEQLNYSWSRGNAVFLWSDIRRWKQTRDFFLLFESEMFARILPKRALSPEEIAVIRAKLSSLPRIH